jgi:hypothetical protein
MAVEMKIKMTPKQAGRMFQSNMKLVDENKKLKESLLSVQQSIQLMKDAGAFDNNALDQKVVDNIMETVSTALQANQHSIILAGRTFRKE